MKTNKLPGVPVVAAPDDAEPLHFALLSFAQRLKADRLLDPVRVQTLPFALTAFEMPSDPTGGVVIGVAKTDIIDADPINSAISLVISETMDRSRFPDTPGGAKLLGVGICYWSGLSGTQVNMRALILRVVARFDGRGPLIEAALRYQDDEHADYMEGRHPGPGGDALRLLYQLMRAPS